MRTALARILSLVAMMIALGSCGGGGDNDKGACVRGTGISSTCGDDFTAGQCDLVNGTFHGNKSCSDLGFR